MEHNLFPLPCSPLVQPAKVPLANNCLSAQVLSLYPWGFNVAQYSKRHWLYKLQYNSDTQTAIN